MGEKKNAFIDLVGKPEGRRLLQSRRLGVEDSGNVNLKELNGRAWNG